MFASPKPLSNFVAVLVSLLTVCFCAVQASAAQPPINALVGDESWTATHDSPPSSADEVTRIRTHLMFVHSRLREANTSHLTAEQRERRARALSHLAEYAEAGVFPQRSPTDGFGPRQPRFIDDRGVHCAVGELVRRSGHPELALSIDNRWEYALVRDIDSAELAAWAEFHGFEARELAMIQPMYAPTGPLGLFLFHFIFAFIFVGWLGFLCSLLFLIPVGPSNGWGRLAIVAAGGWPFSALTVAASWSVADLVPAGITEPLIYSALLVLQIGYTWGGYRLASTLRWPPMSQRATLDRALDGNETEQA